MFSLSGVTISTSGGSFTTSGGTGTTGGNWLSLGTGNTTRGTGNTTGGTGNNLFRRYDSGAATHPDDLPIEGEEPVEGDEPQTEPQTNQRTFHFSLGEDGNWQNMTPTGGEEGDGNQVMIRGVSVNMTGSNGVTFSTNMDGEGGGGNYGEPKIIKKGIFYRF